MRYPTILLALFCVACGSYSANIPTLKPYKMDIQQGNVVTSKMMMQLRPGMSKSQVRFIMGTPLLTDSFHADRWDYFYQMRKGGKIIEQRRVILKFDGDKLAQVSGDVVPASGEGAGQTAVMQPKSVKPAAKEKGLLDQLKFWGDDEEQAPKAAEKPVEPAPAAAPAKSEPKPAPAPVAAPEAEPQQPEAAAAQPVKAADEQPKAEEAAPPAAQAEQPAPEPEPAKPEEPKPAPARTEQTEAKPVEAPQAAAKPAPEPEKESEPVVRTGKTEAKPQAKAETKPQPEARAMTAPLPPDDLPPEDAPEFFEKMLEKIGF